MHIICQDYVSIEVLFISFFENYDRHFTYFTCSKTNKTILLLQANLFGQSIKTIFLLSLKLKYTLYSVGAFETIVPINKNI